MKKKLTLGVFLFASIMMWADEGMWIPMLLQKNEAAMQARGFKLTAEDVYSINKSSLKDAILMFGSGCTGSFVSPEGMVFTNYHCGHSQIQYHSSLEHDYLTNGFWAQTKADELPCPGLTVTSLVGMEDVTDKVLAGITDRTTEIERQQIIKENIKTISVNAESENPDCTAFIESFYYGNQYFLFINQVFKDVRLVGAPPANIGKFGGDTDNWMWPRHTGDFAIFRVYAGKDNKPAAYSKDNVPYHPKKSLEISTEGVENNDFTMVFGYPARTQEYLPSFAIEQIVNEQNDIRIDARTKRLDIINVAMNQDQATRIKYHAKAANISNGWKKWQGENRGIKRMNGIERKQNFEKDFQKWADTYDDGIYKNLLPAMQELYLKMGASQILAINFTEHVLAPEVMRFSYKFMALADLSGDKSIPQEKIDTLVQKLTADAGLFFKDYSATVDKKIFKELLPVDVVDGKPVYFLNIHGRDMAKLGDEIYAKSIFSNEERCMKFLENYKTKDAKKITSDPLYSYVEMVYDFFNTNVKPSLTVSANQIDSLQRVFMKAQMLMQQDKNFYPDANFTLRVAYGKVDGYYPRDAVYYEHYTTMKGIMEKENPNDYDCVVTNDLKTLYKNKDFGNYKNTKGEMPVAFIASNHTTGGNSGSPVLNAKGQLIGLNFDRNWEGTMSDLMYDPAQCRNITLDIRYLLFIVEKLGKAQHLINEMNFGKTVINTTAE